ncbi:hypothetical protein ONZ45_g1714 [Pleurotus djamor]|nr:hypothetical protein ONZ45_g1714 [Pleurotus djamor]
MELGVRRSALNGCITGENVESDVADDEEDAVLTAQDDGGMQEGRGNCRERVGRTWVLESLAALKSNCSFLSSNLASATTTTTTVTTTDAHQPPLPVVLNDLRSLLSLIYSSVTKLAVALKPSSPTWTAASTPIKEISDRVAALSHCVLLIDPSVHGALVRREAQGNIVDVFEAISSLAQTFLTVDSTSNASEVYLQKTGTVHDLIDKAKATSPDNVAAARNKWAQDRDTFADGVTELHEMIMDAEGDSDDIIDDGWDELGLGPSRKMDATELNRSRKAYTVLRMVSLLHKRVLQDLLTPQLSTSRPPTIYDRLCTVSTTLQSAADDFVASLYVPQNILKVQEAHQAFQEATKSLHTQITEHFLSPTPSTLAEQLERVSLAPSEHKPTSAPRLEAGSQAAKWFRTCIDQLDKATHSFIVDL